VHKFRILNSSNCDTGKLLKVANFFENNSFFWLFPFSPQRSHQVRQILKKCCPKLLLQTIRLPNIFMERLLVKRVTYGAAHFLATGHKGVKRM